MPDKKKRGRGKPFFKGDDRIGRNALPPDVKKSKHLAYVEFNTIALELLNGTYDKIKIITDSDNERTDKKMVAAAIRYGVEGNQPSLNAVWDRVYGKPAETVNHTGLNTGVDVSNVPLDTLKKIREMLIEAKAQKPKPENV
jgi:hypothetical protein